MRMLQGGPARVLLLALIAAVIAPLAALGADRIFAKIAAGEESLSQLLWRMIFISPQNSAGLEHFCR